LVFGPGGNTKVAKAVEKAYSASRDRLFAALLRSVSELGYSINNSDTALGTISFSTGMSMRSSAGQNMTATVFAVGEAESKVVMGGKREQKGSPFGGGGQVYDWGEKGKITRKLLEQLDRVLPETPEPAVSSPTSGTASTVAELQGLADLKAQGLLSEDEFEAAKAKLLG
jgi:hypothetical protein